MAVFTVLSRKDAFVDYLVEVEAATVEATVDLAYDGGLEIVWEKRGVVEIDARHVVRSTTRAWRSSPPPRATSTSAAGLA